MQATEAATGRRGFLDMSGYQWTVLLAAWLGWGFDVMDGLLFNYVAPNCVPTLLGLKIGSPEAKAATLQWNGILTSLLLLGWAAGGILFGRICDRIGRTRTLLLTMSMYALGTALCAVAPSMGMLILFRVIASLGIGGEWAAGASMVAEVVPEKRRVEAGALLYTSAPAGLFLATYVTYLIQKVYLPGSPETAWRYVFLFGLIPAAVAFVVRIFVKEPDRWKKTGAGSTNLAELFSKPWRSITLSGLGMALVALIMWWSCNAFIATVATGLANVRAATDGLSMTATQGLIQDWIKLATNSFNFGGLFGTLLTIPVAKYLGRKPMFIIYFLLSAASIMGTFGLDLDPHTRLYGYFFIGLSVFGVFGSFTYYLPELFPTRLRATGSGFCYNGGRIVAAIGPFIVGSVAAMGKDALHTALHVLFFVGFVPLAGLLLMPWVIETRHAELRD
ncbi:MAG TPA: MFS transporter [Fimbriimonadaceae bacterium]|nr:MFS transporter [Fimbriimonadaceae bacterium]